MIDFLTAYIAADIFGFLIALTLIAIVALLGICSLCTMERETRDLEEQAWGDASLWDREIR